MDERSKDNKKYLHSLEEFLRREIREMCPDCPEILHIDWHSARRKKISARVRLRNSHGDIDAYLKYARPINIFRFIFDAFVGAGYIKYKAHTDRLDQLGIKYPETIVDVEDRILIFPYRTLVISEFLHDYTSLKDYCENNFPLDKPDEHDIERKHRLLVSIATLLKKMHRHAVYHLDFHWENLLLKEEKDGFDLKMIDLDKMRYHVKKSKISGFYFRQKELLVTGSYLLCLLPWEDVEFFLDEYFNGFIDNDLEKKAIIEKIKNHPKKP